MGEIANDDILTLKLQIGRAQLATALDLFICDKDPISVHCLACGGAEVLEIVAKHREIQSFSDDILYAHSHLSPRALKAARNKVWNGLKHATKHNGDLRFDDVALLSAFKDPSNDPILFSGWYDYGSITGKLPIEAQIFQVWWLAINEDQLEPSADAAFILETFPMVKDEERALQKRRLRAAIKEHLNNPALLNHPKTEQKLHLGVSH